LKKSVFAAEFEERTGFELRKVWLNPIDDDLLIEWGDSGYFRTETKAIYSRAHLEAAVEAVGEKQ